MLNKIIAGKGYVQTVDTHKRYNRQFRIIISNKSTKPDILIYIFTDSDEYISILNKDDPFEFKGQFIIYTPLNSKRDSYIFDIILEDGALVVE